jgi:hypothetical protein
MARQTRIAESRGRQGAAFNANAVPAGHHPYNWVEPKDISHGGIDLDARGNSGA